MTKIVKLSDRQGPDAATASSNADPETVAARLMLDHYIDQARKQPDTRSEVMTITPIMAKVMLDRNKTNRPERSSGIADKVADIKAGKWVFNGATIVFGEHGFLLDGQHRLLACKKAGIPIKTHVVFGIDRNAFLQMDNGNTRTHSDTFKTMKVENYIAVSAAIRAVMTITSGNGKDRIKIRNSDIADAYKNKYDDILDSVKVGDRLYRVMRQPRGPIAGIHYLFSKISPRKADEFFERWVEGRYTAARGCPIRSLNEKLNYLKHASHGRVHDTVRKALIIKACNAFFHGQSLSVEGCHWTIEEEFPKVGG